ncbi:hypothetical protein AB7160_15435 [Morganella morganii]|uniref:hypothetical protein n=1 Tax=Morganella morganii TaxID=582 RepID=UPI0034E519A2
MGSGLNVSALAADPAGQWLETEYLPAQYDSTTKTWEDNSNEKEQSRVINDGSVKDLNLNNEKTKFTNNLDYHETWFSLQELWAKNTDANKVISITEYRDGVAVPGDASLNAIEDWQIPDNPSAMEEITWKKEEGRRKKEEGRRKKEEGRRKTGKLPSCRPITPMHSKKPSIRSWVCI